MIRPHRRLSTLLAAVLLATALLATALPASAATWEIDGLHSSAVFKVKHLETAYFYGVFGDVQGTITYDPNAPANSSIDVTIDAQSVDTRNANRDEHVKSPDFLNAKQFPTITFKSKSVEASGDDLRITGDLTLLGETREITVTATKTGQGTNPRSQKEMVGFHSEFTVDRTDHGMNFMAGPLGSEITFILSLEAQKQ
ncbi:MAG: polyisoprenoid-binding protein [Acidobacteria bacterium]|nr:MAG: polyisoprenoid-binding protein [Acidobacteriota bacterium]REK08554.1 MAG: polyisoprenoid-binding protein [Acidobacteriota bacterium]